MTSASDYLENELLDHIFGKGAYTPPTNVYVALCTSAPADDDTGSTITEADYTGYARVSTGGSDWNTASGGSIDNANAVTFGEKTGGDDDTVTHFALLDAATDGNLLFHAALDSQLVVTDGMIPEFAAGTLSVDAD